MATRHIHNVGAHVITELTGDELIRLETGSQSTKLVRAKDFQKYLGGDTEVPAIQPEKGAHPVRVSEFPNAEHDMGGGDVITGIQGDQNVNFHLRQILDPLASLIRQIVADELAKRK